MAAGQGPADRASAALFPSFEIRQRGDRMPAWRVPAADPHLEVQMRRGRVAGLPSLADLRAGRDGLVGADEQRRSLAVVEDEVEADRGVLDGVVAGAGGLVARRADRPGERRDVGRPFGSEDVLAFVEAVAARRTVAVFGAAEVVRAGDGEDGAVGDG